MFSRKNDGEAWMGRMANPLRSFPKETGPALLLILIVAVEITAVVYTYLPHERALLRAQWERQLSETANNRGAALERWAKERAGDARLIASYPSVRHLVALRASEMNDVAGEASVTHVASLIDSAVVTHGYHAAHVVDANGHSVVNSKGLALDQGSAGVARQALATGQVAIDFYQSIQGSPEIAIAAPIPMPGDGTNPASAPGGVIVLDADPYDWVYPLTRAQSIPTETEEALLVRRESGSALYLTPLRHHQAAPLTFERSLSIADLGARAALEGRNEFQARVDYRGEPVFLISRKLAGTPWALVVKIDQAEALRPAIVEAWRLFAWLLSATALLTLTGIAILQKRRLRYSAELAASEARFTRLLEQANDAILLSERDHRIVAVNAGAERLYGRSRAELLTLTQRDLHAEETWPAIASQFERLSRENGIVFETAQIAKDGGCIPVEVSVQMVDADRSPAVVSIVRDLRERNAAFERVRFLNRLLRTISEINQLVVRERDTANLLSSACRILVHEGEFVMAWIGRADRETGKVVPIASAGRPLNAFDADEVRFDDSAFGRGPTGTAIRESRIVVSNDWASDSAIEPWRDAADVVGYKASASFPLHADGVVWGVLSVYADETGVFNQEVVALLSELTNDLGFAMDASLVQQRVVATEEELAQSEKRLRFALEGTNDGLWDVDMITGRVYLSPRGCEILGYRPEEMEDVVGSWSDLVCPDDLPQTQQNLESHLAGRSPLFSVEQRLRTKSGGWVWVLARGKVVSRDVQGRPLRMTGTHTDITDRKGAEEALRQSEERFKALIENAADGLILFDAEARVLYSSPSSSRILGFSAAEVLGRSAFELIHPDDAPAIRELLLEFLDSPGVIRSAGFRCRHRDGRWIAIEFTGRNALHEPAVRALITNFRDVSERHVAEQEQRRLSAAVEQSAESIVITDSTGRIQYVNPAFEKTSGYTSAEVIGGNPSILKSGHQDSAFYAAMWQTITHGQIWHGRFVNRRKDGTLYDEDATISPIRNANGEVVSFVAVKRDITQELALENQLRQAQKMEALGLLAGGVAHDFNNLLQAMLTQVTLIEKARNQPEKLAGRARDLVKLIKRGSTTARELLLFARRDVAKPEPIDLNYMIEGAGTLIRRLLRENVALTVDLCDEPLIVSADQGQIDQVLMNLVVNAADAMPGGGRVTIRSGREADGRCWFSVSDTGHGIPEAARDHVFEPFFTTKPRGKGTGLGLSVVHGIVTQHGGTVEFSTGLNRGTEFRIAFPQAEPADTPFTRQGGSVGDDLPRGRGERILIVEDEETVRSGLTEIATLLGYVPEAVATGEDAIQIGDDRIFQLVLTDVVLPGVSGDETAIVLKQRWPELKILLMSGYTGDDPSRHDLTATGARLLQKPVDIHSLAVELRRALDQ